MIYNIDNGFDNSLFAVDLDSMTCLKCDEIFFKYVCQKFLESTEYEDSIDILEYFMGEENEYAWKGFPTYLNKIKHSELFAVLNVGLDCSGPKASPFCVGDSIHTMFLEIVKHCGIRLDEYTTMTCEKNRHIAVVNKDENNICIGPEDIKAKNRTVFLDTMDLIDSDIKFRKAVDYSKIHTYIFKENDYPEYSSSETAFAEISVVNEKTIISAIKNRRKYSDYKIALLNFANPIKPGGAVESGFMGQEEELCRCSTLYKVLNDKSVCGEYYDYHERNKSNISTDSLIYSEDIIIVKSDEKEPIRMDSEEYIKVDVITMAAPYCGNEDRNDKIDDATLYELHVKRARHMMAVAAYKGVDVLILGAFGCGAFKNNPTVVAKAYGRVTKEFSKCFKCIEYAVYSQSKDNNNYEIFEMEINNLD